jgi:hypothetical protein
LTEFVDAIRRDESLQKVADVADDWAGRNLEKSSTQHDLAIAQHTFVSVKIMRLALFFGETKESGTLKK